MREREKKSEKPFKNSFETLTPTFNDASRGGDVHRLAFFGGGEDVSALQGRGDAGVLDWGSGLSVCDRIRAMPWGNRETAEKNKTRAGKQTFGGCKK